MIPADTPPRRGGYHQDSATTPTPSTTGASAATSSNGGIRTARRGSDVQHHHRIGQPARRLRGPGLPKSGSRPGTCHALDRGGRLRHHQREQEPQKQTVTITNSGEVETDPAQGDERKPALASTKLKRHTINPGKVGRADCRGGSLAGPHQPAERPGYAHLRRPQPSVGTHPGIRLF